MTETAPYPLTFEPIFQYRLWGGRQLGDQFQILRPTAKVLYISGHTDDAVVRHGIEQENVKLLQKPFSPLALTRKVREVLDDPA